MLKKILSIIEKNSEKDLRACEKLEKKLLTISKPQLSNLDAQKLRSSLLSTLARHDNRTEQSTSELLPTSLQKLGTHIQKAGQELSLPQHMKASLKERILTYIQGHLVVGFDHGFLLRTKRFKFVSYVLLFTFVTSSLFLFPFQSQVAQAHSTYLTEIRGDVFVLRNRQLLKGKIFLDLKEGDVILTKGQSFVTIHFFDDSLSRLGENTQLEIQKLYTEPLHHAVTQVGVFLKEGRMWTRVINLIDDTSNFTIATKEAHATVSKKAAFDMSVEEGEVKLAVFDNVVDLVPLDTQEKPQSVVAGYAASLSSDNNVQLVALDIEEPSQNLNSSWVESNLDRDQVYDQELIEEKEKSIDSDHDMSASEDTTTVEGNDAVLLANEDVQKATDEFMSAYRELKHGETMLVRGFHSEGIRSLKNFQEQTRDVIKQLPDLQQKDSFGTDLLRKMIEEKISLQLKDLAAFLPGERLYVVKEVLQDVQQLLPLDQVSKTQLQLSHAEGKLLEIQELIKDEKVGLAITILKGYENKTAQFVLTVNEQNIDELQDELVDIINQQLQQIKALMAIEQNLKNVTATDEHKQELLQEVTRVRRESLQRLVVSLDHLPEGLSAELVTDLKNIFDVYLAASNEDEDLIIPAFNKLVGKDYQLSFIQPDDSQLPKKLGAVTVVSEEATADVKSKADEL